MAVDKKLDVCSQRKVKLTSHICWYWLILIHRIQKSHHTVLKSSCITSLLSAQTVIQLITQGHGDLAELWSVIWFNWTVKNGCVFLCSFLCMLFHVSIITSMNYALILGSNNIQITLHPHCSCCNQVCPFQPVHLLALHRLEAMEIGVASNIDQPPLGIFCRA